MGIDDLAGALGGAMSDGAHALEAERLAPLRNGEGAAEGPKKKSRGQEPRRASTSSQPAGLEEVEAALSQHISTLDPGEIPTLDFGLARLVRQLVRERRNGGSPEPPTQALDPALLDDTVERIRRHLIVADEQADAMALWVLGAHAFDCFDVSPPLHIASPVRRTGKTRALDTLGMLVPKPWGPIVQPSEAVLYRFIQSAQPTLLLDEVGSIFGRKAEQVEGVRALLNAGNQRGTTVPRCVGTSNEIVHFSIYCPKVLAGIGSSRHDQRPLDPDPHEAEAPQREGRADPKAHASRRARASRGDRSLGGQPEGGRHRVGVGGGRAAR